LPTKFRELTILLTTAKLKSTYEFTHHTPVSKAAGVTDEQREILKTAGERKHYFTHTSSDLFDEKETALLQFVEALIETETGDVEDALFDKVKELFGDREVVEVVSLQVCDVTVERCRGEDVDIL
jgi:alkylhydroperoxidase family enzyme